MTVTVSVTEASESPRCGLSLQDIDYGYPHPQQPRETLPVLREVSLQLPPGSITVLLGPSGCGKSTLLQVIAGLLTPCRGSVSFDGINQEKTPVHKRGFVLLFQDGQLFAHRSVGANIAYGLQMKRPRPGPDKIREQVRAMLDLVQLSGYESRSVTTLSGGQAGRVALARALAPQPRLLLLDEPLSALDQQLRYDLAADLRRIVKESGTTALYVTHDQNEAALVADRVGVMLEGQIRQLDTWSQLLANPVSAEVAQFLESGRRS